MKGNTKKKKKEIINLTGLLYVVMNGIKESIYHGTEGVPLQNMPDKCIDYFELKTMQKL